MPSAILLLTAHLPKKLRKITKISPPIQIFLEFAADIPVHKDMDQ